MKLVLASIATGILVPGFLLTALLFTKILFPDGGSERAMVAIYLFCWPIVLIRYFPGLSTTAMLVVSFALGTLLDGVIVSVAAYLIFKRKLTRRTLGSAAPPPPPSFNHSL